MVKLSSAANGIDYEMKPGQIAVYDKTTNNISTQNTDTDMHISWIRGEYRFREMPLEEIARRFERYFSYTFTFDSEELKQRKFTGTFYNHQSIETILQVIQASTDMQYSIEKNIVNVK